MPLPRTAMSLLALMIFTGYLVSLVFGINITAMFGLKDLSDQAQYNIIHAGDCKSGSPVDAVNNTQQISICKGTHWYDALWYLLNVLGSAIFLVLTFLVGIFFSMAIFMSAMLGLPIQISQIIVTIFSVGFIFALIKFLIPDV